MMNTLIISLFMFIFSEAYSFSWQQCRSQSLVSSLGFAMSTSASQFISSTGGCAMLGLSRSEESKRFYIVNFDKIQEDAAKGNGEYLKELAYINRCSSQNREELFNYLRTNYRSIMLVDADKSYALIEQKLNNCVAKPNLNILETLKKATSPTSKKNSNQSEKIED
ncbi:MAG: DUF3015 family protein [Bacteriovoracaceae bacterium]|nr:DUF3015 family protein [Bacteriovoracaceae bacterium]